MVEVTIESDFENQTLNEKRVHKMSPCNLAFVVCITPNEREGEGYYYSNIGIVGEEGLNIFHMSESIARCTVKALIELADDSRTMQAVILTAYMKEFIAAATEMMGVAVMEEVTKLVRGKE